MATQLRRCLYIGLGGTGMNAILQTKKMFVENYKGQVPPMIGFLGIDTDGGIYDNTIDSKYGDVALLRSEQCPISVKNPKDFYLSQKENLLWLPEENADMITTLDKGAGQVRSNGKLAFVINKSNIERAINTALAGIRSKDIVDNEQYEVMNAASKDEIHLVFSVCGGTGCGTFLDVAYLIRKICGNQVNITGYAVLPNVFNEMVRGGNAMAKTKPNAYGALQDLDYLMHLTPNSKKIQLNWLNEVFETNDKPFNSLNLIDNVNENNVTYQHVDELTEMISLALISAAGQIGTATASVGDNVEKCMIQGDLDVGNKKAWVSSIGTCEIVFKGEDIAQIYALKASNRIIQLLLNSCESGNTEANRWIDSPEVCIRENNGHDNVIDYLFDMNSRIDLSQISDCSDPMTDINAYYSTAIPSDLNNKVLVLRNRVASELQKEVSKLVNKGECAISTALDTIKHITKQVQIFLDEMRSEQSKYEKNSPILKEQLETAIRELKDYQNRLIKFSKVKDGKIQNVLDAVRNESINKIEILRRIYAIQFFESLQGDLTAEYGKVKNIEQILRSISTNLSTELNRIQNQVGKRRSTVEIDLSEEFSLNVKVNEETLIIKQFINNLPTRDLYNIKDLTETENALLEYCSSLTESKSWRNCSIDNVIDKLTEEQFETIVRRAIDKAMPLLKVNSRGKVTKEQQIPLEQAINKYYYVCLPNTQNSRFTRNDNFKNMNPASMDISFISTGLNDKIIIYRQEGTVPVFAVECLETFKREYENCSVSCHFDTNILRRMENEEYNIFPTDNNNDAVEPWVKGFIFGFIKVENGKYKYRDWKSGSALKKYWISIDEKDRDLAFNVFSRSLTSLRKQYEEKINEIVAKEGTEKITDLIADVKENYFEKYSMCEVPLEKMEERGNEGIATLMEKELNHVENKL